MSQSTITASCLRSGSGGLKIYLRIDDPEAPQRLCEILRGTSKSDEDGKIPDIAFDNSFEGFGSICLRRTRTSRPEILCIDRGLGGESLLIWEGDSEYWLESGEKCEKLMEGGSGHQYLMPRNTKGDVTVSFREAGP